MALSNIRNEPRREITEQLIGILGFLLYIWLNYLFVTKVLGITWMDTRQKPGVITATFMSSVLSWLFLLGGYLIFTVFCHWLGEIICAIFADLGFDPRPKTRYKQKNRY